jgi:hypothetical protein
MRMMLKVTFPNEPFATLVKQGAAGRTLAALVDEIKPEAAYFTEQDGKRGAIFVVDVPSPSDIPRIAEPLFLKLNAECRFGIAMKPEDLQKSGLDQLAKKWG